MPELPRPAQALRTGGGLKRAAERVETPGVKICPSCEAELRDSVIRCTRCGRALREGAEAQAESVPERVPVAAAPAVRPFRSEVWARPSTSAPASSSSSSASSPSTTSSAQMTLPPPPVAPAIPAPAPQRHVAAARPALAAPTTRVKDRSAKRALPDGRKHSDRPDPALLLAALAAVAAAFFAWRSLPSAWVELTITDTSVALDPQLVGRMKLTGDAAMIGTIALGLAAVLGALGVIWLAYGFRRGATIPMVVSPAFAILASVGGIVLTILSMILWFVWKDAAVAQATSIDLSVQALRDLLDLQPAPLVEITRLDGLTNFGLAMVAGLLASSMAWWAYRKRD